MIRILHEVAHSDNTWDHHYYISTGRSEGMFTIRHRYQERIWTSRFGPENKDRDYHVLTLANNPEKAKAKAEQWAQENKVELENMNEFDTALRGIKRGEGGIFPSGKYSGMTAQEVYEQDPGYLEWAYRANAFKSQVTLWKNIVALVGEDVDTETESYKVQAHDMLDRLKAAGSPLVYDLETLDYTYDTESSQNKVENDLANMSYTVFLTYSHIASGNGSKSQFEDTLRKAETLLARVTQNQASEYQGQIGDTIEITGTLKFKSQSMQNRFGGWMRIYSIQTNNGIVVYKGDNAYFNSLETGSPVHFQATVKAHDEYQGTKQTVVTRIKPLGEGFDISQEAFYNRGEPVSKELMEMKITPKYQVGQYEHPDTHKKLWVWYGRSERGFDVYYYLDHYKKVIIPNTDFERMKPVMPRF